jgi:ATP-dependent DNA helicase RecQ
MAVENSELHRLLREQFGHEAFRPGQERVIRSLLAGRDVLAVLPTGAGKSLVFQLTAQLLPGLTLVVSPLLALMKDQADSVEAQGLEVGVIHSHRSASQMEADLEKVKQEEAKLLYVTPERFENAEFLAEVEGLPVSLLVVDEAHCVSEWGFDFRPAYLGLAGVAERLGRPTLLALTATATPWVRRDIVERLGLREPEVVVRSADRPNLFFEVRRVEKEEEDHRVLRALLIDEPEAALEGAAVDSGSMRALVQSGLAAYPEEQARPLAEAMRGSGIIYTATTKAAAETAEWLREWGIPADYYHGQRAKADRERVQEAFMAGELRVIAATNAFGLGVDKPDVRFVIHRDIPASVEAYYQEAGRAGRDGHPARCVIIYRPADLGRAAFLSASSQLSREEVRRVSERLEEGESLSPEELAEAAELSQGKVARVVALLEREAVVEQEEGRVRLIAPEFDPEQLALEGEERRHAYERSRLQMMRGYAELWDCRRRYLLNYFGQEMEERCGWCDNDLLAPEPAVRPEDGLGVDAGDFVVGARVRHPAWGEGQVSHVEADTLTVLFAREGEKKLALDLVREEGLLEVVEAPRVAPSGSDAAPALAVGVAVVHLEFGKGEVERVAGDTVTVLFEREGYKTLAAEAVDEGELMKRPEAEAEAGPPRE